MIGCQRRTVPGWHCTRGIHFDGPCALRPKWWNVTRFATAVRRSSR